MCSYIFADSGKKKRNAKRSVSSLYTLPSRDGKSVKCREYITSTSGCIRTRHGGTPPLSRQVRDQAFAFFHASTLALLIWVSFSAVYLDSAPPLV